MWYNSCWLKESYKDFCKIIYGLNHLWFNDHAPKSPKQHSVTDKVRVRQGQPDISAGSRRKTKQKEQLWLILGTSALQDMMGSCHKLSWGMKTKFTILNQSLSSSWCHDIFKEEEIWQCVRRKNLEYSLLIWQCYSFELLAWRNNGEVCTKILISLNVCLHKVHLAWKISEVLLLHDNARPHTSGTLRLYPTYSPHITPWGFNVSGPLKNGLQHCWW